MARQLVRLLGLAGIASTQSTFAWDSITPSPDLQYHDCFNGFRCARLQVPLDWQNPKDNRTAAIAITAIPASVPEDDPSFGGTIVAIYGGPGGSGVGFIQSFGPKMKLIVDGRKHYEYLSYDPRGVGASTPAVDCFAGDRFARDAFLLKQWGIGPLDRSRDALERQLALTSAYGKICEQNNEKSGILPHVSTTASARDVLEIVDRTAELRRKNKISTAVSRRTDTNATDTTPRLLGLGLSYGTVVANTFASMYPGRVGKLLFDAVDDAYDYMRGDWLANLADTEEVVRYFYETCFNAGAQCPLKDPSDTGPSDIKARVDKFIDDVNVVPLSVTQGNDVFAVTGSDLRRSFRPALYSPYLMFRGLAQLLADAMAGNYTLLIANMNLPSLSAACSNATTVDLSTDTLNAIACSDASDARGHDVDHWAEYVQKLKNQSISWGESWATIRFACSGWKVPASWRFDGPFMSPPPSNSSDSPAAPLLFLSGRYDPATPLRAANKMSQGHPDSVVVVQNSYGHSALGEGWSECLNGVIREYFDTGVVPPPGKVCENNCKPWQEDKCDAPKK